jgi:hypothetical protein
MHPGCAASAEVGWIGMVYNDPVKTHPWILDKPTSEAPGLIPALNRDK